MRICKDKGMAVLREKLFCDSRPSQFQDKVSKTYSFPKSYVSYRKPRAVSTEQRERARQMMIERNKAKEVCTKFNGNVCAFVVR